MSLHVCTVVQLFRELRRRVDRLYKELERIEQMPDETLAKLANGKILWRRIVMRIVIIPISSRWKYGS